MMKRLFSHSVELILSVVVLLTAIIAFQAVGLAVNRKPDEYINYHPEIGIVVDVDSPQGIVVVRNGAGTEYCFYGFGFQIGDVCALIMDDLDTPMNTSDDAVVDARIVGTPNIY